MTIKKKRNKNIAEIIDEFKEKISRCQEELSRLEEQFEEMESKVDEIVFQMHQSRDRDKELRKKIEIIFKKIHGKW